MPPPGHARASRPLLSLAALCALALAVGPPLSSWSARYSSLEALQYCLLAIVVPALTALGAPWRLLGLGPWLERLEAVRHRESSMWRAGALVLPSLAVFVVWRLPALVDRLARDRWLLLAEAVTLVPAGVVIWLECVPSSPMSPRLPHFARIALAAITMWTIWVLAYLVGLANSDMYSVYSHVAHRTISAAADQQLTAGVLWFMAAVAFVPVVFTSLTVWLRNESPAS